MNTTGSRTHRLRRGSGWHRKFPADCDERHRDLWLAFPVGMTRWHGRMSVACRGAGPVTSMPTGPNMPANPAERYPHSDCTSDKAPAGDGLSGSGPGGERVHRGNPGRHVLTQEMQSKCGYPAASFQPHSRNRGVEAGELPVNAPRCDRTVARIPGKGDHSKHLPSRAAPKATPAKESFHASGVTRS
jgi:hypothetical protein